MARRPNFIVVMTDQQQAYQFGCMGHPDLETPHVDALAMGGVLFERAYTANPVCTPSRQCLITGLNVRGIRSTRTAVGRGRACPPSPAS